MSNPDPRQHSAEHILTAVFGHLFNGKILDFRFKGDKVRCDFEIETDSPLEDEIYMDSSSKFTISGLVLNESIILSLNCLILSAE